MGISDNNLRISFDYKYPDNAALVVFNTTSSSFLYGSEPSVNVKKVS